MEESGYSQFDWWHRDYKRNLSEPGVYSSYADTSNYAERMVGKTGAPQGYSGNFDWWMRDWIKNNPPSLSMPEVIQVKPLDVVIGAGLLLGAIGAGIAVLSMVKQNKPPLSIEQLAEIFKNAPVEDLRKLREKMKGK